MSVLKSILESLERLINGVILLMGIIFVLIGAFVVKDGKIETILIIVPPIKYRKKIKSNFS